MDVTRWSHWTFACLLLAGSWAEAVELRLLDRFSCTVPDTAMVWRVQADATDSIALSWSLSMGGAVMDRGQRIVPGEHLSEPIEVSARIPPLREGVTGSAMLSIVAESEGALVRLHHPVTILPLDPWIGLRATLEEAVPVVMESAGRLRARLQQGGIQTTAVRNARAMGETRTGLILVEEGISARTQRGLVDALLRAAAAGARVLWLAPAEGAMPLPGHEALAALPRPAMRLEPKTVLQRVDPRLDVDGWAGAPNPIWGSAQLSADRRQPEAVWTAEGDGWPWLDLDFRAAGGGRLLVVGWAMESAWDAGPVPRHLLAGLIRHVLE